MSAKDHPPAAPDTRSGARPRARRGEGDRTREEILDAAERLLVASRSEEAVSIRAVAEEVGVTPPAIYRHFPDKAHLLFETCGRQFDRLDAEAVAPVAASVADPIEALRQIAVAYVRWGLENPEHYRIMFMGHADHTPELYDDARILEVGCFASTIGVTRRALAEGRLRGGPDDALLVTTVLWSAIHGLVATAVAKPNMPLPDVELVLDAVLDAMLNGLATDAR